MGYFLLVRGASVGVSRGPLMGIGTGTKSFSSRSRAANTAIALGTNVLGIAIL